MVALLSPEDEQFLRDKFAKEMKNDVQIDFYTQHKSVLTVPATECPGCQETRQILDEVVGLSDKIHLTTHDFIPEEEKAKQAGIEEIPMTIVSNPEGRQVRYLGLPAGYEFPALIEDIIDLSNNRVDLSDKTKEALKKINQPVNIQVFITPT